MKCKKNWCVVCWETWDIIEQAATEEEAQKILARYEEEDREEGC